jgi:hypothetical protein
VSSRRRLPRRAASDGGAMLALISLAALAIVAMFMGNTISEKNDQIHNYQTTIDGYRLQSDQSDLLSSALRTFVHDTCRKAEAEPSTNPNYNPKLVGACTQLATRELGTTLDPGSGSDDVYLKMLNRIANASS